MRSRSSRFFIVLLHLVGVTTHWPRDRHRQTNSKDDDVDGAAAAPAAAVAAPYPRHSSSSSSPMHDSTSTDAATMKMRRILHSDDSVSKMNSKTLFFFTIEDEMNGSCLGPDGYFTVCSDTTLWALLQRPISITTSRTDRTDSLSSSSSAKHIMYEYAIQYIDWDIYHPLLYTSFTQEDHPIPTFPPNYDDRTQCLTYNSTTVHIHSCLANQAAWKWSFDSSGKIMYSFGDTNYDFFHNQHRQDAHYSWIQRILLGPFLWYNQKYHPHIPPASPTNSITCHHLHRCPSTNVAIMSTCPIDTSITHKSLISITTKLVPFSISLQFDELLLSDFSHLKSSSSSSSATVKESSSLMTRNDDPMSQKLSLVSSPYSLNGIHDTRESDITGGVISSSHTTSHFKADVHIHEEPHLHPELKYPSDLLFSNRGEIALARPKKIPTSMSQVVASGKSTETMLRDQEPHDQSQNRIFINTLHDSYARPQKTRKIPTHPYLIASKDGLYEDPRTGLMFFTDLCPYLGYDKYTYGRQTLMGMGHYYRTLLKIKVYGVALYVSKRDVLADSFFIPYASMTAKELTQNDTFYQYLYSDNRKIERTLFLKMNMQITVNSMRASLEADWKLLSPEHKAALIESSFKKRDADQNMLKTIQNPDNPSHCSCGQSAPEIFKADPSCCSRGTVMSFTWLKNGDMELRIDGRVMDTFSSSGMAQGIFHEYLRGDDPISIEARNNFAEGFPFLLAPLSKVKMTSMSTFHQPVQYPNKVNDSESSWTASGVSVIRNAFATVIYHQYKLLSWFDTQVMHTINKVAQFTMSLEKYREQENDRLGVILEPFFHRNKAERLKSKLSLDEFHDDVKAVHVETSRHSPPSPIHASDELSLANTRPKTTFSRRLFIITVHFYLLLLLIVSIPDSFPTKVIVTKKSPQLSTIDSESDNDERNEETFGDDDSIHSINSMRLDLKSFESRDLITDIPQKDFQDEGIQKPMPKAFSYCL